MSFVSAVLDDPAQAYYLYAVVPDTPGAGGGINAFMLSPVARSFNQDTMINLLVGILNSERDGARSFATLYGYTEILPGRILVDLITSAEGNSWLNLANGTALFGNAGYTQGMDFGVTAANQLTIKGAINALSAVLGGFQIDNDKLQSLAKTGGVPNISLNGTTGTASITGSFRSVSFDGYSVEINRFDLDTDNDEVADTTKVALLLRKDGAAWVALTFDEDGSGGSIDLRGQGALSAHFNNNGVAFRQTGASPGILTSYERGKLQLGTAFRANDQSGVIRMAANGLPTSASLATPGYVYVDSNGFLKKA